MTIYNKEHDYFYTKGSNPEEKDGFKTCSKCGESKPLSEYYQSQGYYKSRCKSCNPPNTTSRFSSKGITEERFLEMLKEQDNKCSICLDEILSIGRGTHIDHCHETGNIRGLLCYRCNMILGFARDNILILNSAIKYLEKSFQINGNSLDLLPKV